MLGRIAAGAVVLLLAAVAIAVPLALTEARVSRSTSESMSVQAYYSYTDPLSGDQIFVSVLGSEHEQTIHNTATGPANSQRAAANRGRANSPRNSPRANNPRSFSSNWVSIYIDHVAPQQETSYFATGSASPTVLSIDRTLTSARLVASVDVYRWVLQEGIEFSEFAYTVEIHLEFSASGPLSKTRDNFRSQAQSPRTRFHSITTTSHRPATVTGTISADGRNLADGVLQFAAIATYESKSLFQN
jgi:hypothetical protein